MTSAENCISEPPNLKFFLDPPTRLVPSALAIMPLVTKNLATSLGNAKKKNKLCHFEIPFKSRERKEHLSYKLSSFIQECTCFSPSAQ